MTISLSALFADSNVATIGGRIKEFIGTTLSMDSDTHSIYDLKNYTVDNFCYARCIIEDEWAYAYNGKILNVISD